MKCEDACGPVDKCCVFCYRLLDLRRGLTGAKLMRRKDNVISKRPYKVDKAWFRDRFEAHNVSASTVAHLMGFAHRSALHVRLAGKYDFTKDDMEKLSRILGEPYDEIARRVGVDVPYARREQVAIVGTVQWPSGLVDPKAVAPRRAPRPTDASGDIVALRIGGEGHPMAGWLVYYVPGRRVQPEAVGALCVAQTGDGATYARFLGKGAGRGRWCLEPFCSRSPAVENVIVSWASPVLWIKTG